MSASRIFLDKYNVNKNNISSFFTEHETIIHIYEKLIRAYSFDEV